jgi:hypothetical protein
VSSTQQPMYNQHQTTTSNDPASQGIAYQLH